MATTHDKVTSANEYFDKVVKPDFRDFCAEPSSLRKAFHCAVSLFHMHDWVFQEFGKSIPDCKDEKAFSTKLADQFRHFAVMRDVANASKHMLLRTSTEVEGAQDVIVQSTGWGEDKWGEGAWGGAPRVRIATDTGQEEFRTIAQDVLSMWVDMLKENDWRKY